MDKPMYKSKTIVSISVVIVIVLMSLVGVGESEIGQTIDTMETGQNKEALKEIITLLAAGMAIYGRRKAGEGKKNGQ